jgi:hypothetical protein
MIWNEKLIYIVLLVIVFIVFIYCNQDYFFPVKEAALFSKVESAPQPNERDAYNENKGITSNITSITNDRNLDNVDAQINDCQKLIDEIKSEIKNNKNYREFEVSYDRFENDLDIETHRSDKMEKLSEKTKNFFKKNGLLLNWKEFENLGQDQRINTLAMIAPISNEEKQTILESDNIQSKTTILSEIIEFYLHEGLDNNLTIQ